MSRYAIGDVQGCFHELRALLTSVSFSPDRDRIWFVGDLVNRGPQSLEVLRYVRDLGDNAVVVLGNHDLHLLAVAFGSRRKRKSDTLDPILEAADRDPLLEWLLTRSLVHLDTAANDLLVHAGLVPQWTAQQAVELGREVEAALRSDPRAVFDGMYGDEPTRWSEELSGSDRLRFTINAFTRLRVCSVDGKVDLKIKGKPAAALAPFVPWFEIESRRSRDTRVIFGHWSALGLVRQPNVLGLDTGCVWGGSLTAVDLDQDREPIAVQSGGYLSPGDD